MQLSIVINTVNRKEMLFALIDSIYKCNLVGLSYEVIVVDDASDEDYSAEIRSRYSGITFMRNTERLLLIRSRNAGWKLAKGRVIHFIDDDNEILDSDFYIRSVKIFDIWPTLGILGCRTNYFEDKGRINMGPTYFNKYTGKTSFLLRNKEDADTISSTFIKTHDCPNAFFVRRDALEKVGGFSQEFFQTFSEADFAEKIRKSKLDVVECSDLKVYHKYPFVNVNKLSLRQIGGSPMRVYYLLRNRYLFIKKHGTKIQMFTFGLMFAPLYSFFYFLVCLKHGDKDMMLSCSKATLHGYKILLSKRQNGDAQHV